MSPARQASRDPACSVVIPTHESAAFIGGALESCLRQTADDLEVIVVDDGSTDDTVAIVEQASKEDARISLITTAPTSGAEARNIGAEAARGRLLTFLDSDDLLMPTYLETVADALSGRPSAAGAYSPAWVLDERTRKIRREFDSASFLPARPLPDAPEELMRDLIEVNFIGGVRTLRPEAFASVGGFDGHFRYVEDYDLWLRLIPRGWELVRLPEPLAILRDRPGGLHTHRSAMISTLIEVMEKVTSDEAVPEEPRGTAERRLAELAAELRAANRPGAAALWRAKVAAVMLRRRLRPSSFWFEDPPPEVSAAFGDLSRL